MEQGMEQVLDSLRRIIGRWAKTTTPLTANTLAGHNTLTVRTASRFAPGEDVILRRPAKGSETEDKYEWHTNPNLQVSAVLDENTIVLNQPLQNNWLASDNAIVVKAPNGNFIQGVYIGDPENISHYPAITVNGISTDSEWLTIDSVKEVHNVEIGVFVEDSTQEAGYRYMLQLTALIKRALQNNIFPLVNDYQTTALTVNTTPGSWILYCQNASIFCPGAIALLEDAYKTQELRVQAVDTVSNTVTITPNSGIWQFNVADGAILIAPNRLIFNSYPKSVQFGKINKGSLLKAAVIQWFGWEEVIPNPTGGGAWSTPQIV